MAAPPGSRSRRACPSMCRARLFIMTLEPVDPRHTGAWPEPRTPHALPPPPNTPLSQTSSATPQGFHDLLGPSYSYRLVPAESPAVRVDFAVFVSPEYFEEQTKVCVWGGGRVYVGGRSEEGHLAWLWRARGALSGAHMVARHAPGAAPHSTRHGPISHPHAARQGGHHAPSSEPNLQPVDPPTRQPAHPPPRPPLPRPPFLPRSNSWTRRCPSRAS